MNMDLLTERGFICELDTPQKKIFRRKDVAVILNGNHLTVEYDLNDIYDVDNWTEADLLVPVWLSYMTQSQREVVEEVLGRPNMKHLVRAYTEEDDLREIVEAVIQKSGTTAPPR